jgi:tetratricopeptide (TPR) repeat protein
MRVHTFVLAAAFMSATPVCWADIVRLNDGSTIKGDIKKSADGWFVTDAHGKVRHITTEEVRSIELAPRGDPKEVAMGRLASLRRSVEALNDPKQIIDRYEKFIEQNKDESIAQDAKKDLAEWRERLAQKKVKVGSAWVTPEERSTMQEKALLVVDQARELLKQNKVRDADAAVTKALEADPSNVSALYLKGLIAYRQDQIPAARKAFEAVKEAMPDHGPALNNLAVILWRQNQQMAAIGVYLQAMQAMPLNMQLLNNVAEALNALTDEQRKAPLAQKAIKLWTEQDAQLQQQMMTQGLYRWGATWVDKSQYDKLQVAEKEVKDKIAKLEGEFADAQAKVDTIDSQMRQNRDAMRYMEQQRVVTDSTGKQMQYPLPPQYWDYDRANRRLEVQRKETVALLDAMRAKAQAIKGTLPAPKFTGVQLVMGVEGTPAIVPADKPGGATPVANLADELLSGGGGAGAAATAPPAAPATPEPSKTPVPETKTSEATKTPEAAKTPEAPKAPTPPADKPLKY